ncbi:MAG: hypothetical protein Kow0029_23240 [Candidatus Rifleibacteriota bacterium]
MLDKIAGLHSLLPGSMRSVVKKHDFEDPFDFDDDLAVLNAALIALNREEIVVQR